MKHFSAKRCEPPRTLSLSIVLTRRTDRLTRGQIRRAAGTLLRQRSDAAAHRLAMALAWGGPDLALPADGASLAAELLAATTAEPVELDLATARHAGLLASTLQSELSEAVVPPEKMLRVHGMVPPHHQPRLLTLQALCGCVPGPHIAEKTAAAARHCSEWWASLLPAAKVHRPYYPRPPTLPIRARDLNFYPACGLPACADARRLCRHEPAPPVARRAGHHAQPRLAARARGLALVRRTGCHTSVSDFVGGAEHFYSRRAHARYLGSNGCRQRLCPCCCSGPLHGCAPARRPTPGWPSGCARL